jgi:TM2 domain-containing membrane protein YozV
MKKEKDFTVALLVWFFFGGLGGHRIYIQEKLHYLFWYWIVTVITFGIFPIIDLFSIKGLIEKEKFHEAAKAQYYKNL